MKRKLIFLTILLIVIMTVSAVINHYRYRQVIGDFKIVHYISCHSENLDYMSIHLNVVLPEKKYYGNLTMNLIRIYVIIRNEKIPDHIEIVLYENMESLSNGDSYAEKTFNK